MHSFKITIFFFKEPSFIPLYICSNLFTKLLDSSINSKGTSFRLSKEKVES